MVGWRFSLLHAVPGGLCLQSVGKDAKGICDKNFESRLRI